MCSLLPPLAATSARSVEDEASTIAHLGTLSFDTAPQAECELVLHKHGLV